MYMPIGLGKTFPGKCLRRLALNNLCCDSSRIYPFSRGTDLEANSAHELAMYNN